MIHERLEELKTAKIPSGNSIKYYENIIKALPEQLLEQNTTEGLINLLDEQKKIEYIGNIQKTLMGESHLEDLDSICKRIRGCKDHDDAARILGNNLHFLNIMQLLVLDSVQLDDMLKLMEEYMRERKVDIFK